MIWDKLRTISEKALLGVRSYGENHTEVQEVLNSDPNYAKKFQKFIRKAYGIILTIDAGRFTYGTIVEAPVICGQRYFDMRGICTVKPRDGYITLYFRNSPTNRKVHEFHLVVDTILALLREKVLCQMILDGEITSAESLARECLILSKIRGTLKDTSYMSIGYTQKDSWADILTETLKKNSTPSNGEATDFFSLACLGLYTLWHHNKYKQNEECLGAYSGPVSYMKKYSEPEFIKLVVNTLDVPMETLQTVWKRHEDSGTMHSKLSQQMKEIWNVKEKVT
jgi:hypothetical protein